MALNFKKRQNKIAAFRTEDRGVEKQEGGWGVKHLSRKGRGRTFWRALPKSSTA